MGPPLLIPFPSCAGTRAAPLKLPDGRTTDGIYEMHGFEPADTAVAGSVLCCLRRQCGGVLSGTPREVLYILLNMFEQGVLL